jgi:hypothetical protein
MLHIIRVFLQQGLEAGMVLEGGPDGIDLEDKVSVARCPGTAAHQAHEARAPSPLLPP